MANLFKQLKKAKEASLNFVHSTGSQRAGLLKALAQAIGKRQDKVLAANQKDLKFFSGDSATRERLQLTSERIAEMTNSLISVAKLRDPLNNVLEAKRLANGLVIKKISVPLGVVGVIYESRPNVTVDLAALALKTGNAAVLKGGKESIHTNKALVSIIQEVLHNLGFPKELVLLVNPKSEWKKELLNAYGVVDVLIPRGGAGLIDFVRQHSHIPVIETGAGVCHTFVDEHYNLAKAATIVVASKVQRPAVCNALDTLVVHKKMLLPLLNAVAPSLAASDVEIFADRSSFTILKFLYPAHLLHMAKPSDFGKEFLSLKMSIKTVSSFRDGLNFIRAYTSGHSESILTNNKKNAKRFLEEVDAAVVYHNASTRFTDGGEFGMGAEVGISTQKLHARGPMGAGSLTSYKWMVFGQGQMRK